MLCTLSVTKPCSVVNPPAAGLPGGATCALAKFGSAITTAAAVASVKQAERKADGFAWIMALRGWRGSPANYERIGAGTTPTTQAGLRPVKAAADRIGNATAPGVVRPQAPSGLNSGYLADCRRTIARLRSNADSIVKVIMSPLLAASGPTTA